MHRHHHQPRLPDAAQRPHARGGAQRSRWLDAREPPPLVDVFICTYNEDEAILERTIIGALSHGLRRFRVWVLDDGRRPWLEALCERLGAGYLTRPDNAHAKAGNINNGLKHVAAWPSRPTSSASSTPISCRCRSSCAARSACSARTTSASCRRRSTSSIPTRCRPTCRSRGVWPDEQRYFFDVVMASKDAWGAAFCCGTSSVIRFPELQRIGGFPDRLGDGGLPASRSR